MMKRVYEVPDLEVISFQYEDVMTVSVPDTDIPDGGDVEW